MSQPASFHTTHGRMKTVIFLVVAPTKKYDEESYIKVSYKENVPTLVRILPPKKVLSISDWGKLVGLLKPYLHIYFIYGHRYGVPT
jgi:uncharacterized NAD-dependent epimerase/dehydratase family protein